MSSADLVRRWARRSKDVLDGADALPTVRFVVVTPGRAGSVLLSSLLDSHPDVQCEGELFMERDPTPLDTISRHSRSAARKCTAWGFLLHPDQLLQCGVGDVGAWLGDLHNAGFRIITLVRRNALHRALSASIAFQRGTYASAKEDRAIEERFRLDPTEVLHLAAQAVDRTREVHDFVGLRSHLALTYEDDLSTPDAQRRTASRAYAFLRVPDHEAETPFVPRSQGFAELISNWDELAAVIGQTQFASELPSS